MSLPLQLATVSLLRKGEKTLFLDYRVKQDHPIHAGKLSPPGGKLENIDKSSMDGAVREIFEETKIIKGTLFFGDGFLNTKNSKEK